MLFQTLDDKSECVGVYSNGELHFKDIPDGLSKTWGYSNFYMECLSNMLNFMLAEKPDDVSISPRRLGTDYKQTQGFHSFKSLAKVN